MTAAEKDRTLAQRIKDTCLPALQPWFLAWPEKAANTLRLAQLTLHRWAEEMCNGTIQREEVSVNGAAEACPDCGAKPGAPHAGECNGGNHVLQYGKPFRVNERFTWPRSGEVFRPAYVPDREAGALRRVEQVCKEAGLHYYHQTDPRGCALWVAAFPLDQSNYNQGIACL